LIANGVGLEKILAVGNAAPDLVEVRGRGRPCHGRARGKQGAEIHFLEGRRHHFLLIFRTHSFAFRIPIDVALRGIVSLPGTVLKGFVSGAAIESSGPFSGTPTLF